MIRSIRHSFLFLGAILVHSTALISAFGANAAPYLETHLIKRGELLFADSFNGPLQPFWKPQYKTRWAVAADALTGQPASPEDQAGARDRQHNGASPSIQLNLPTKDCILQFSFQFTGQITALNVVFNDGDHLSGTGHVCELQLHSRLGSSFSKKKNTKIEGDTDEVLSKADWKPAPNQWYTVILELSGDCYRTQIDGGPTLSGKHPRLDIPKTWLTFGSWNNGTLMLRDLHIWQGGPRP